LISDSYKGYRGIIGDNCKKIFKIIDYQQIAFVFIVYLILNIKIQTGEM